MQFDHNDDFQQPEKLPQEKQERFSLEDFKKCLKEHFRVPGNIWVSDKQYSDYLITINYYLPVDDERTICYVMPKWSSAGWRTSQCVERFKDTCPRTHDGKPYMSIAAGLHNTFDTLNWNHEKYDHDTRPNIEIYLENMTLVLDTNTDKMI